MSVIWDRQGTANALNDALLNATEVALLSLLGDCVRVTPHKTGTLRRSGTVTRGAAPDENEVYAGAKSQDMSKAYIGKKLGDAKAVYISFNTPYALRMHEGGDDWKWSESGTGPKFLEGPVMRGMDRATKFIQARIKGTEVK